MARPAPDGAKKSRQALIQRQVFLNSMATQAEHLKKKGNNNDDDDSYRTEDGSDTENIDSSNRGKRPATKTPFSSKAASQAVSPADEDSSADEDDSDEELDVQDEVDLSIEQLQKRIQKGKITGATNCDLIDSLSGDYRKQKEKMAKSVSSLKKEVKKLENEKKGLEEELEKEIEAHEITKQNLVDLKAKYKAAMQKAKSKRTSGKAKKNERNEAMTSQIGKETKKKIWPMCKFVDDQSVSKMLAKRLLAMMKIDGYRLTGNEDDIVKAEIEAKIDDWVDLYHEVVTTCVNGQRNYLGTEMRKATIEWMVGVQGVDEENKPIQPRTLPTLETMKKIVMRDLTATPPTGDPQQESEAYSKEVFFWYYTKLLPIACGAHCFGEKYRRTNGIYPSNYVVDGVNQIPPGTEAITIMMYDNCFTRWTELYKWRFQEGNDGAYPTYTSNVPSTKRFKGKYSDNCAGQDKYGGWDDDGIEGFEALKQAIDKNRKDNLEDLLKIEKEVQQKLEDAHVEEQEQKLEAKLGGKDSERYQKKVEQMKRKREKEGQKNGEPKKRRVQVTLDI